MMIRYLFSFFLCLLTLSAQEEKVDLVRLRSLISEVVDTNVLASQEATDWKLRKAEMSELLELHRKELELLDEELGDAGGSAPGHLSETEKLQAEVGKLKSSRKDLARAVTTFAPRALALIEMFPVPLQKELVDERQQLASWRSGSEPREALQSLLAVFSKAHDFNRRFTVINEIIDSRRAKVLYLGLAQAFYLDGKDGAGIGRPTEAGWTWEPRTELSDTLSEVFAIMEKQRPPALVKLPLKLD